MSSEDYDSFEETMYLLKNPFNAGHLLSALDEKSISFQSIEDLKNESGI